MIGAFLFAVSRMSYNRVASRLRHLRQPRYILSALAAGAYFWFVFFRRRTSGHIRVMPASLSHDVVTLLALVLLSVFIAAWGVPQQSGGLEFSESEIHFLFTAPVSRAQLLLYKFMRSQWRVLFGVLMAWVFGARRNGNVLGMYCAFAAMSMYFTMTSLGRARLKLARIGAIPRMIVAGVLLAGLSVLVTRSVGSLATPHSTGELAAIRTLERGLDTPVIRTLLFVPGFFAHAILPANTADLAKSILALALLAALFFLAAVRLNVSFEEASIEVSKQRTAARSRMVEGRLGTRVTLRSRVPFHLAPGGRPELALVWKNLIATIRVSLLQVTIFILPMLTIALMLVIGGRESVEGSAMITCGMAIFFALLGPIIVRTDLRIDMSRLDMLKSYPIPGDQLVAAEMAAPLVLISLAEIVFITTAWVLCSIAGRYAAYARPEYAVVAFILIVPLIAIELLIQNAIVILLPAWTAAPSRENVRGFLAMGQRLLLLAGQLIALAIAVIPAAIVGIPSFLFAQRLFPASVALAISALLPAAVLVIEIWLAVRLLGTQFDAIDPTSDLEPVVA